MIAKKKQLNINELKGSSLQFSLQSCQLYSSTCLQAQVVLYSVCKELRIHNQHLKAFSFAGLFANNSN